MAASPFSFHCMICFEEFHPDDRYPVVLPCGHTYVCNHCAERLDKCMECRTALFVSMPRSQQQQANLGSASHPAGATSWSSARAARAATFRMEAPVVAPVPPIKTRLPLPKNVVLLSLIEATELATEDANKAATSPGRSSLKEVQVEDNKDAEDDEEEKIKAATSLAVSVCGTYAVASKKGLAIYPSRPTRFTMDKGTSGMGEEDVDALVRFFHLDHKLDVDSASFGDDASLKSTLTKEEPPAHLTFGDRVQIVSVDGDWAKLSRGYGFIRAGRNDLVKVGGPLDRACKLEAMLRSLSARRKELRKEQNQVDNRFVRLMNDLQTSLLNDEDLTVVVGEAFTPTAKGGFDEKEHELELRDNQSSQRAESSSPIDVGLIKPVPFIRQITPPMPTQVNRAFACFADDVFESLGASQQDHREIAAGPAILEAMTHPFASTVERTTTMDENRSTTGSTIERTTTMEEDRPTTLFPAASHPSPGAIRAGARAWRERNGIEASETIDFRTGLSGHLALTSSHAYSHEYLARKTAFPRMSSHSGLTMTNPFRRSNQQNITRPPSRETPERKESSSFDRSGSM